MISDLFRVPLFVYFVQDWENKKKQFYPYIERTDFRYQNNKDFQTDRFSKRYDYRQDFAHIFSEELEQFRSEVDVKTVALKSIWSTKYTNPSENHCPHNHSSSGYTGILYLDYDSEVHSATTFISPWNDPVEDTSILTRLPHPAEGIIYIWPSFVLHYCESMRTSKMRTIVSWDMELRR